MLKLNIENGFTTVECLIASLFFAVLIFIIIGCSEKKSVSFHDETIKNLGIIQIALERYAVEHNGEYPKILIGGEMGLFEAMTKRPPFADNLKQTNFRGGGAQPPGDPLIDGGYLARYPANPFIRDWYENPISLTGGNVSVPGSGDIRFGMNGNLMGNIVDDPRFLWDIYTVFDQPDKSRLQPTRLVNTFSPNAYEKRIGSIHPRNEINPFYAMGGLPDSRSKTGYRARWFPGQFLYRATGDMVLKKDIHPDKLKEGGKLNIWDFEVVKFDRYILAAYGDKSYSGLDLVRITTLDEKPINNHYGFTDDTYARSDDAPYDKGVSVFMSSPELFGGGGKGIAPFFPFYKDESGERIFIYGAPDGFPDGILTPVFTDHDGEIK